MTKHANVAIFIPHNGCKNQCSFCNQKNITGANHQPSPSEVDKILIRAIDYKKYDIETEVAFFGGSFTAINHDYMKSLLEVALSYVNKGYFSGIRISTRPDAIDIEILKILKRYKVTTIELGAQSMNDDVLKFNHRGHTRNDIINAAKLIKSSGFALGLQMMTGLYKSSFKIDYQSGMDLLSLKPEFVRIYPTIVLRGTELEKLYDSGVYNVMSFDETVKLCCKLLLLFESNNVSVIRLGLHFSESLNENIVVGAFHPAFREICESKILFDKVLHLIKEKNILKNSNLILKINPQNVSKFVGQKKINLKRFEELGYTFKIKQDICMKKNEILIEKNCG